MTNKEYIKLCSNEDSNEELADVIFNIITISKDFAIYLMKVEGKTEGEIKGAIMEWLNGEHNDGIQ